VFVNDCKKFCKFFFKKKKKKKIPFVLANVNDILLFFSYLYVNVNTSKLAPAA